MTIFWKFNHETKLRLIFCQNKNLLFSRYFFNLNHCIKLSSFYYLAKIKNTLLLQASRRKRIRKIYEKFGIYFYMIF